MAVSVNKLKAIKKIFYPRHFDDVWFSVLENLVKSSDDVLEIGSGSGTGDQNTLYPKVKYLTGIDLDERVHKNPFLDEGYVLSVGDLSQKFEKDSFDLIYSHMVAEHIENADEFIEQQMAILRMGGIALHSTVSKYYLTSILNLFIPNQIKYFLIARLGSGRKEQDIFPAYYNLNDKLTIRRLAKKYDLTVEFFQYDEPPGYLRKSYILMILYVLLHKPMQYLFPSLRPTFIFILRK